MPRTKGHFDPEEARMLRDISERLQLARTQRGMSLISIDIAAEIGFGTCSRLETGVRPRVTLYTLTRIARALGVKSAWLILGEGPMVEAPTRTGRVGYSGRKHHIKD